MDDDGLLDDEILANLELPERGSNFCRNAPARDSETSKNGRTHTFPQKSQAISSNFIDLTGDCQPRYSNRVANETRKNELRNPLFDSLNDQQLDAVLSDIDKPLVIIAGAGSGKTSTMCNRILHILETSRCVPWSIYAMTFSRNAAREMRERVEKLVGSAVASKLNFSTIHSLCCRIVRKHSHVLDLENVCLIRTAEQKRIVLHGLLNYIGRSSKKPTFSKLSKSEQKKYALRSKKYLQEIMRYKSSMVPPDNITNDQTRYLYQHYQDTLQNEGKCDFSDMITFASEIFTKKPQLRNNFVANCKFLLVDEFQDTTQAQLHFINLISSPFDMETGDSFKEPCKSQITVVGDDDQSIYSFAGATTTVFSEFQNHFCAPKVVKLERNYRSTKAILKTSNSLIAKNVNRTPKELWTEKENKHDVELVSCPNEKCEEAQLVETVLRLLQHGAKHSDIAVISRRNKVVATSRTALEKHNIPVRANLTVLSHITTLGIALNLLKVVLNKNANHAVMECMKLWCKSTPSHLMLAKASENSMSLYTFCELELGKYKPSRLRRSKRKQGNFEKSKKYVGLYRNGARQLRTFFKMVNMLSQRMCELQLSEFMKRLLSEVQRFVPRKQGNTFSTTDTKYLQRIVCAEAEMFCQVFNLSSRLSGDSGEPVTPRQLNVDRLNQFVDHLESCIEDGEFVSVESKARMFDDSKIWCGTVHQSKGLEWKHVIITRFNYGDFPACGPGTMLKVPREVIEEERRITYVAITRAKETVQLLNISCTDVSPFTNDIHQTLCCYERMHMVVNTKNTRFESMMEVQPPLYRDDTALSSTLTTMFGSTTSNVRAVIVPAHKEAKSLANGNHSAQQGLSKVDVVSTCKARSENMGVSAIATSSVQAKQLVGSTVSCEGGSEQATRAPQHNQRDNVIHLNAVNHESNRRSSDTRVSSTQHPNQVNSVVSASKFQTVLQDCGGVRSSRDGFGSATANSKLKDLLESRNNGRLGSSDDGLLKTGILGAQTHGGSHCQFSPTKVIRALHVSESITITTDEVKNAEGSRPQFKTRAEARRNVVTTGNHIKTNAALARMPKNLPHSQNLARKEVPPFEATTTKATRYTNPLSVLTVNSEPDARISHLSDRGQIKTSRPQHQSMESSLLLGTISNRKPIVGSRVLPAPLGTEVTKVANMFHSDHPQFRSIVNDGDCLKNVKVKRYCTASGLRSATETQVDVLGFTRKFHSQISKGENGIGESKVLRSCGSSSSDIERGQNCSKGYDPNRSQLISLVSRNETASQSTTRTRISSRKRFLD